MENTVASWLESKFRDVQDVKNATIQANTASVFRNHDADIVVETWMNSRLHVYIVDKEMKSRAIKNTLKNNTGASIGTLFIVNNTLLPSDGKTTKLPDWQDDLRVLNGGSIYSYGCIDDELAIIQVNLTETVHRNEFDCWHTRDFPFDAVSVRRREFSNNIKGTWYIGDIASPQFKRRINQERARQRFHYRTKRTQEVEIAPQDRVQAAYLALQIEVSAGQEVVKEAFRKLAREYHPDVTEYNKKEAEKRFKEIKQAYDTIKENRRWK